MKPLLAIFGGIKITMTHIPHKTYKVVICLVLLISPYGMGTTIFVVLHGDNIWIAADSLQTANTGKHRYSCKINTESSFYWGASSALYEDVESGYSIQKMVTRAASTKGTIISVMKAFINIAKIDSATEISFIKRNWPADFAKLVQPDHTVLVAKIVFIGKGNGHTPPVVYVVLVAREVGGKIIVSGTPITPPQRIGNFELASSHVAQDYFSAHTSSGARDPVPIMRDSMLAAANDDPVHTGGKISILKIAPDSNIWIDKGECQ